MHDGGGREIAFSLSHGGYVMVLDTDVVYSSLLRRFVDAYLHLCRSLSIQAIFCGSFPREQWIRAGGRRSLNTNEDVDVWLRIHRLGTMRWFPVSLGENVKEAVAWGKGTICPHGTRGVSVPLASSAENGTSSRLVQSSGRTLIDSFGEHLGSRAWPTTRRPASEPGADLSVSSLD